jgi:hypothetical protein
VLRTGRAARSGHCGRWRDPAGGAERQPELEPVVHAEPVHQLRGPIVVIVRNARSASLDGPHRTGEGTAVPIETDDRCSAALVT